MKKRLESYEEFLGFAREAKARLAKLEEKTQVKVHMGTCGISSGSTKVLEAFNKEMERNPLKDVVVVRVGCIGLCGIEPVVTIVTPGKGKAIYHDVTEERVHRIFDEHVISGKPINEWILPADSPRFKYQEIRIMHNQDVDARNVETYIARDGYQALAKALTKMTPDQVLKEVEKSGLRGRGGAGFPTATKWGFIRSAQSDEKFIICNADEGDPGAYMNRTVQEANPHSIIEGMVLGAYAIGNVRQGYAYPRAEYPGAIASVRQAINDAHELGLLGKNILGTGFDFDLDIFAGSGAFVCGEETALLSSIEGKRGNPRQRPPFPANVGGGLFGKPSVINNVETWSSIPLIIHHGAEWFASVGTGEFKGTKTFCLVGKTNFTGLIEVPLGTPLGRVVFDLGGGTSKKFKAVQIGGPSGGVLTTEHLNTPLEYKSVPALGAIMGSGGLVAMDEDNCMVDIAKYFLEFCKDESCGKCTACRAGIPEMLEILNKITRGEGELKDIDILTELAEMVGQVSLCGLGQTSPNPVLTTLRYFRDEYEAHIIDKKCPAAVCRTLFRSPCQHTCPVQLDIPGYTSLIKEGKFAEAYCLIKQRNPFPAICGRVCHHPCELKCNRTQIDEPIAIRELKRFAADYAFKLGIEYAPKPRERKAERVAIIGAGPAGLSCAWDLSLEGYPVTVFEALPVAGGMLAVGIPDYRLPKDILKKEIQEIENLGVEINLNTRVDDIESLLNDGYKAVFIAAGAHTGDKMGIPGEDLKGVYDAIEFLRDVNLGRPVTVGAKVAVVGAGNSAIDAARVALRKGAREVHIVYRREKKDMPAITEEIEAAEREGVRFHFLVNPVRVLGDGGRVTGLEVVRQELKEFDRSGRRTPYPEQGSEHVIPIDMLIEGIGQRPDTSFIKDGGVKVGRGGTVVAEPRTLATGVRGVFAGGDAVTGPQTAIEAIAHGQRAASSIKRYLQGRELTPMVERNGYEPMAIPQTPPTDEETQPRERAKTHEISLQERRSSFKEVSLTFSPDEAKKEALRCLRCDLEVGG